MYISIHVIELFTLDMECVLPTYYTKDLYIYIYIYIYMMCKLISIHVIELFTHGGMCSAYILYKRPVYICMMCKSIHLYKQSQ